MIPTLVQLNYKFPFSPHKNKISSLLRRLRGNLIHHQTSLHLPPPLSRRRHVVWLGKPRLTLAAAGILIFSHVESARARYLGIGVTWPPGVVAWRRLLYAARWTMFCCFASWMAAVAAATSSVLRAPRFMGGANCVRPPQVGGGGNVRVRSWSLGSDMGWACPLIVLRQDLSTDASSVV